MGKPTMWFPNRSDTNQAVQAQKQARSLKFRIKEEEKLYYPCSENKGADQLRGYREADLRLCFRLSRLLVFPCGGSYDHIYHNQQLIIPLYVCHNLKHITRKLDFCLCENKGADQLCCNCTADRGLCFHSSDSTIPLSLKSKISSF